MNKGKCNTCGKQRMINMYGQCFWCWDKEN